MRTAKEFTGWSINEAIEKNDLIRKDDCKEPTHNKAGKISGLHSKKVNKIKRTRDCINKNSSLLQKTQTNKDISKYFYLVGVAPDCNRSYCEDSFSGYAGSV